MSIWKEEVDIALCRELKESVYYYSKSGERLCIPKALVRKPEEDFNPVEYPCASIYNTGDKFNPIRYKPKDEPVSVDPYRNLATMKKRAVTFDADYTIDLWSLYQRDMNEMVRSWLINHFRQFNLPVVTSTGEKGNVNCLQLTGPVKSDLISGGKRLFHTVFSYRIWVEISDENLYNVNVATKVLIDVKH